MAFLPEKFGGAQKHARSQLPANDVGPLVDQHRQVAPALDPLGEEVADDGLRRRPDHVRLFQLLAAGDRHHRQLGREAFDVLGFLVQKTLRDEQRKIDVLMAGGLEAIVQLALQQLPHGVAVGLDDHAAFDDFRRLSHVALQKDELTADMTALEWLRQFAPLEEGQVIRGMLGRMLFSGEEQDKNVKVLSGGECQRMVLARLMLQGNNMLILDEPTNHMDLESIESLSKALSDYTGTVIFTSHDQDLISKVADRVLELKPDGSYNDFKGSYAEYLEWTAAEAKRAKATAKTGGSKK